MSAVLADQVQEAPEDDRRIPGRDRSWIEAAFKAWGDWIWENRDFEGYPTAEHVTAFLNGAGGGARGHRVLCRDCPPWILFTHVIWLKLPEHEAVAVWAEYVPGVGDDGRLWTREQKCERLGIGDRAFRKRLQCARVRIWEWSRKRRN
jgi:hypothetical protein